MVDVNHGLSSVRSLVSVFTLNMVGAVAVTGVNNSALVSLVLSEPVVVFGVRTVCGVSANGAAGVVLICICHGVKSDASVSLPDLLTAAVV